ncbi:MAG: hypothetical protein M1370_00105 [Bacteroidetes bacterium]|nr:hypothetical protein [Bacteroidota bacterium]MCL5025682.1 hypothetical protein [Chloroflexota bacterium]
MYAINHAATALAIKSRYRQVPLLWLFVGSQLIELMWVAFQFLDLERIKVKDNAVHLDYLPFSHSLATGLGLGILTWLGISRGLKRPELGQATGIAVASHILLDLPLHEPDIQEAPFVDQPKLGGSIYKSPALALILETAYGICCWWTYGGSRALLAVITLFNLLNLPFLFPRLIPGILPAVRRQPKIVAALILLQILATWLFVGLFSRRPAQGS